MILEEEIKEFKRNMTDGSICCSPEIIEEIIDLTIEFINNHKRKKKTKEEKRAYYRAWYHAHRDYYLQRYHSEEYKRKRRKRGEDADTRTTER